MFIKLDDIELWSEVNYKEIKLAQHIANEYTVYTVHNHAELLLC
jgi:hypothetical protein